MMQIHRSRMRIFMLAAAATLSLAACSSDDGELGAGDTAPSFVASTFDGTQARFPELLDGKPTVVVFWATWCSYCKAFMPYLKDIQADYGERINILTINAKEDGTGNPADYIAGLEFPSIAVANGDAIALDYDVEFIPGLMIVDGDGDVAWRREWTDLPAGETVANLWSLQVRGNLNILLR